ncbi:RDD family protein [Thalassomonas viridans]|uniref:RDD family protein n=1 Tax=Thalassomonas viridans TaxID=137584 RepID=A0AAF0C7Z1_9GAMM|nr:RDD family protein [Thalassomonas viridans]WDE05832.1 RDD family protein [Thalassomonas viridans]
MTDTTQNSQQDAQHETFPRAGFMRRFGGWVYDVLLAIAVYMTAGAVSFLIFGILANYGVISMQGHDHLIDLQQSSIVYSLLIYGWNFGWVAFFFVWFWSRSGQTLGMKAWRLRVQNRDGSLISKKTAIKRLLPTLLGLGNLWVLLDRKNKLSLQDKLTDTEVVTLSKEANRGRL